MGINHNLQESAPLQGPELIKEHVYSNGARHVERFSVDGKRQRYTQANAVEDYQLENYDQVSEILNNSAHLSEWQVMSDSELADRLSTLKTALDTKSKNHTDSIVAKAEIQAIVEEAEARGISLNKKDASRSTNKALHGSVTTSDSDNFDQNIDAQANFKIDKTASDLDKKLHFPKTDTSIEHFITKEDGSVYTYDEAVSEYNKAFESLRSLSSDEKTEEELRNEVYRLIGDIYRFNRYIDEADDISPEQEEAKLASMGRIIEGHESRLGLSPIVENEDSEETAPQPQSGDQQPQDERLRQLAILTAKPEDLSLEELLIQNRHDLLQLDKLSDRQYKSKLAHGLALSKEEKKSLDDLRTRVLEQNKLALDPQLTDTQKNTLLKEQTHKLDMLINRSMALKTDKQTGELSIVRPSHDTYGTPVGGGSLANTGLAALTNSETKQEQKSSKKKWAKRIGAIAALGVLGFGLAQANDSDSITEQVTETTVDTPDDSEAETLERTNDDITSPIPSTNNGEAGALVDSPDTDDDTSDTDDDTLNPEAGAEDKADDSVTEETGDKDEPETTDTDGQPDNSTVTDEDENTPENTIDASTYTDVLAEPGSGVIKEISQFAEANNIALQDGQAFAMYQAALDTLGPQNMLTVPLYEISPDNWGISSPGEFSFTPEMVNFMAERMGLDVIDDDPSDTLQDTK